MAERSLKLEIRDMTKRYDNGDGVEHINLKIYEGEIVTMLGPSGCGKSTILRTIGGFLDVTDGDILIDNESIVKLPPEKRPTAMVFQSYNLWPHMTVYDNMECQELLDLLAENQVSRCYFGHIHGQYAAQKALVGEYKGVHMRLISADYVQFCPVRVE